MPLWLLEACLIDLRFRESLIQNIEINFVIIYGLAILVA